MSIQSNPREATTRLSSGVYTIPDAAKLLQINRQLLRRWLTGYPVDPARLEDPCCPGPGAMKSRGLGRDRHFGFLTLIEIFTAYHLRTQGFSMHQLRLFRNELAHRFDTEFPFALRGLLTSGRKLLKEMGNEALLEVASGGQTAFEQVLGPFCEKIEFDSDSNLAVRFFPKGRQSSIVVDPKHAFGQPVIAGTNLTTAALASRLRGGESDSDLANDFDITEQQVREVRDFELALAA
jgi:uncharacterized protein (DUF433 family)